MKELMHPSQKEVEDFLLSSVRLKLWFLRRWLFCHPDEPFSAALEQRVDIFRKTSLNPGHLDASVHDTSRPDEWKTLAGDIESFYDRGKKNGSFEEYEELSMARLSPFLLARAERDTEDIRSGKDTANYQCGSLRYNLTPDSANPQRIGFHIANACHPGSPFADRNYFPACFIVLMTQCQLKFGVTEIGTSTWLNSNPKWLELFPQEWQNNLSLHDKDVQWHYGFWGQFLTARKTFNHHLAAKFRQDERMPFLPRTSWCSIAAMKKHLLENFL